jgi:hypothetical protein
MEPHRASYPRTTPGSDPRTIEPHAAVGGLIEAFDEVLNLRQHLLIAHGLAAWSTVHHHGPLEVGDGADYRVYAVIVGERPRPLILV